MSRFSPFRGTKGRDRHRSRLAMLLGVAALVVLPAATAFACIPKAALDFDKQDYRYNPGDTLKAIGLQLSPTSAVVMKLEDPSGRVSTVGTAGKITDDTGAFRDSFALASNAAIGDYVVSATAGLRSASQTFTVEPAGGILPPTQIINAPTGARTGQNGLISCTGERSQVLETEPSPSAPFRADRDEIYTLDPDSGVVTLLTNNSSRDSQPDFSPDGTKLVFESFRSGGSEAYTMNPDGTNVVRITRRGQEETFGDWSPDGRRIVFLAGGGGDWDILRTNFDGSNQKLLTEDLAHDRVPAWTADGTRVAYDSNRLPAGADDAGRPRDDNFEIYTMDAEAGDSAPLIRLTNNPARDIHPQYSPDGKKIVFQSHRHDLSAPKSSNELYIMNADGTEVKRLTFNDVDDPATKGDERTDASPVWSPDGTKILFESARIGGDIEVFMMNADGSGVTRLTNHPGFDGGCDWGARPASPASGVPAAPPVGATPAAPPVGATQGAAPPTPTQGRGKLSARVTAAEFLAPFRFTTSGRLTLPSGVTKAVGCRGKVSVQVKRGAVTLSTRRVSLRKDCTYSVRVTFKNARRFRGVKSLKFTARFLGNARVLRATATPRFGKVRP